MIWGWRRDTSSDSEIVLRYSSLVGSVGDTWRSFVSKAHPCSAEPQDPHPIFSTANTSDCTKNLCRGPRLRSYLFVIIGLAYQTQTTTTEFIGCRSPRELRRPSNSSTRVNCPKMSTPHSNSSPSSEVFDAHLDAIGALAWKPFETAKVCVHVRERGSESLDA